MTALKQNKFITFPIYIGLIFTLFINGWNLLLGEKLIFLKYLNIYNITPIESYPSYFEILLQLTGIAQLLASLTIFFALVRKEFFPNHPSFILKYGVLLAIFSITLFGFMVRISSNHGGAANLYFYMVLLYFLLWYIEKQSSDNNQNIFNNIKLLPIYFSVFYTMGFPGWQKIINPYEVMGKYIKMFDGSFLSKLPGGTQPLIYFLGAMETAVVVLLIVSLVKREFLYRIECTFLNFALLISMITFVMLSFGLGILTNYPGSTNLIFYAILTLGLYAYISYTSQKQINTNEL
ncbi:hypothetical protein CLU96_4577 [Chryseobacterium sp. 52]|uniref:hypothetical protein n=1 Tax=Chryseobacterium sp. 52 TaxID=2035213 RepID=UPI000C1A34CD|nr:hypothetical protein [Chryseobacterium sp. 52]PIF47519.1 hypothetical protein CLU96_4577 [Chryseobacterium sp. 52]